MGIDDPTAPAGTLAAPRRTHARPPPARGGTGRRGPWAATAAAIWAAAFLGGVAAAPFVVDPGPSTRRPATGVVAADATTSTTRQPDAPARGVTAPPATASSAAPTTAPPAGTTAVAAAPDAEVAARSGPSGKPSKHEEGKGGHDGDDKPDE
jgi:hypothetical protein